MSSHAEQSGSIFGLALAGAMSTRKEEDHAEAHQIHVGPTLDAHASKRMALPDRYPFAICMPRVPKSNAMASARHVPADWGCKVRRRVAAGWHAGIS